MTKEKKEPTSIYDLYDRLDNLHADLSIIEETVNTIESALSEEILDAKNVIWALIGVRRNVEKSVEEAEMLSSAAMEIYATFKECVVGSND